MNIRLVAPLMALPLLLAGCGGGGHGGGQGAGQPGAAAVAKDLDAADQSYMSQQTSKALETVPTNQTATWVNPDSQSQASLTPTRTYQQPDSTYCREYTQTVAAGAQQQKISGTACRQADGTWRMVGG